MVFFILKSSILFSHPPLAGIAEHAIFTMVVVVQEALGVRRKDFPFHLLHNDLFKPELAQVQGEERWAGKM